MLRHIVGVMLVGYGALVTPLFGAMASSEKKPKVLKGILHTPSPLSCKASFDDSDCGFAPKRLRVRSASLAPLFVRAHSAIDEGADSREGKLARCVTITDATTTVIIETAFDLTKPAHVCRLIDKIVTKEPSKRIKTVIDEVEQELKGSIKAMQNNLEQTLLHTAAQLGLPSVIAVVIAAGVDKDQRDIMGNTALILAVRGRNLAFVEELLRFNPNVTLCDGNDYTALWHAHENNDEAMEKLLVAYGLTRAEAS